MPSDQPVTQQDGIPWQVDMGPDDVLVLTTSGPVSDEAFKSINAYLENAMSKEGRVCLVLEDGLRLGVVHRTIGACNDQTHMGMY